MKKWICALLTGGSLVAFAPGAYAQSAPPQAADEEQRAKESDIIVTGSRLVQDGYQAPTPVTVLSAESLEQFGAASIPEALRDLPSLVKSNSSRAVPLGSSGDPNANLGNYLNLRNLGNQRSLLLMDGMRVPPTRSNGLTDANVVPQFLVSRVEVVTGGASAAYGSDAVAGVINYIMNNRFTGIKGSIQGGVSQRGDDVSYRGGLAVGTALMDDRLHIVASAEYRKDKGIDSLCARPLGCRAYAIGGIRGAGRDAQNVAIPTPGTATNPFIVYEGVSNIGLTPGGYISAAFNANGTPNTAGALALAGNRIVTGPTGAVLAPYARGTQVNTSLCILCDGGVVDANSIELISPLETAQFYGHAEFDITPDITVWAQGNYGQSKTHLNLTNEYFFGTSTNTLTIYSGNAFLSPAVQALMNSTGTAAFQLDGQRSGAGNLYQMDFDSLTKNRAFQVGIKGNIANNWKWKIYGADSVSSLRSSGHQSESAKLYAALDAVRDPSGNIVCRVTLTNPGVFPGCVPLNLFGADAPSQAAKDYVRGTFVSLQKTTLKSVGGDIAGSPFSTWAGPVAMAVGAEWRKQTLNVTSNTLDPVPKAGVRFGTASDLRFRNTNIFPTTGSATVREQFAEVDVPLLKDSAIARSLNINGAVRFTDYSNSGKVTSWKVGGAWQINNDLRLRVTRSRDIRAPTLDDLFGAPTQTTALLNDTHLQPNVNSAATTVTRGNPDLKPEKANTWTVGAVFNPAWLPGFNASVDWYQIRVTDAIQSFGGVQLIGACEASNGTSPLCAAVVRPGPFSDRSAANFPTLILAQSFNANKLIVKGVDLEASYRAPLAGGQLNLRLLGTYQYEFQSQASPVNPLVNSAGYQTNPKLNMTASIGYDKGPFGIDFRTQRVGSWDQNSPVGQSPIQIFQYNKIDAVYYSDLSLTYDLQFASAKKMQVFLNISNLFDRSPPLIPNAIPTLGYPTTRALYDVVGRSFSAGVRFTY